MIKLIFVMFFRSLLSSEPDDPFVESVQMLKAEGVIPIETQLLNAEIEEDSVSVFLKIPDWFIFSDEFDEVIVEEIVRGFVKNIPPRQGFDDSIKKVIIYQRYEDKFYPLTHFLPEVIPVPLKPYETEDITQTRAQSKPLVYSPSYPKKSEGFLKGKHIYISQCHGWYYSTTISRWATQRGNTHNIVEDFVNPEAVNQYLVQYFLNAGATVFTVKEFDMNEESIIVDDGDFKNHPENGIYEEFGEGFFDSTLPGFKNFKSPYQSGEDVMTNGKNRVILTSATSTSFARYTPYFKKSGYYAVYVSYSASYNRASDAHYIVNHDGGKTEFRVNQKKHGGTWVYLGTFYFNKGANPEKGSVEVHNDSSDNPGQTYISLDAVRFGGGMGVIIRGKKNTIPDSKTSMRPKWEECSRYYAQFTGAPTSVYDYLSSDNKDDVVTRSRYSAWQHEEGEDAVYISWHTNAPDGGTGTSTFVYGPNEPNGQYIFTGTKGSDDLAKFIHNQIISDIRKTYDPNWTNRGIMSAWFGELNPSHNPEMPACLVEVAFHATKSDAELLKEPLFRKLVARAFYKGVVKYFAKKDGKTPVFAPEPPTGLCARYTDDGSIVVSWLPSPTDTSGVLGGKPEGYIIYHSTDGKGFDNGMIVGNVTSFKINGLKKGITHYFKVSAYNAGGESFPSHTVGAYLNPGSSNRTMVVLGFHRLDKFELIHEDLSIYSLGDVLRMFLNRMNTFSYIVNYGEAYEKIGLSFDSCWNDGVVAKAVDLSNYSLVNWELGEESTADSTFSKEEQAIVSNFLKNGGAFIATGAEIGWDLVEKGDQGDVQFFESVFKAEYVADDADSYVATDENGNEFDFDNSTHGTYNVDYPDVIDGIVEDGGKAFLFYDGDENAPAGVYYNGSDYKSVIIGFPFETVFKLEQRVNLLKLILAKIDYEITQSVVEEKNDVAEPDAHSLDALDANKYDENEKTDQKIYDTNVKNETENKKDSSFLPEDSSNDCFCDFESFEDCPQVTADHEECSCDDGCSCSFMNNDRRFPVSTVFIILLFFTIITTLKKQNRRGL